MGGWQESDSASAKAKQVSQLRVSAQGVLVYLLHKLDRSMMEGKDQTSGWSPSLRFTDI